MQSSLCISMQAVQAVIIYNMVVITAKSGSLYLFLGICQCAPSAFPEAKLYQGSCNSLQIMVFTFWFSELLKGSMIFMLLRFFFNILLHGLIIVSLAKSFCTGGGAVLFHCCYTI